jgi:acyl phosphate:glycerol-3-phosphate acyltransferase
VSLSVIPACLLGYLIGSVPSAFLVVHWRSQVDIRRAGSGNVGALNSLEVTGSRWVGAAVLLIDLAKGMLVVWLCGNLWEGEFWLRAGAGLGAVIGHNYPVWLSFQGGRGLSTAAGVMFLTAWSLVPVWLFVWLFAFLVRREVNLANAVACIVCLAGVLVLPGSVLGGLHRADVSTNDFRLFCAALFLLLLVKLEEPVRAYMRNRNRQS